MSGLPPAQSSRRHKPVWDNRVCNTSLQSLFLVLCCLLSASGQSSNPLNGNSDSDGQALQSIRTALNSPAVLSGWAAGNPCTSNWTGVTCSTVNGAPRVTTLALNGVGLKGSLPDSLIKLTALQILNMSNNAISGPLPSNWGYGDVFTQLQIVTLDNNQVNGSLPAAYSQGLRSLIVFNLDNNNFSGGLPEAWGSAGAFPLLRVLAIKNSSLAGPLPSAWGNSTKAMPSLTILTLDSNALSYGLPASWAQGFPSLSLLTLAGNQINGTLPMEWGQNGALPKLAIAALDNNNISGTFPDAWASSSAFPSMRGSGNGLVLQPGNPQLSGPVPLGTPYPVLRYNGPGGYTMCSQFPCTPLASAPGPSVALAPTQATEQGQNITATFNLQGEGLYPLSTKGKQALVDAVNQTLSAQGTHVANISVGEVTDLSSAAPPPAGTFQNARRRQLLQGSPGAQAQVAVSTIAGASNQEIQGITNSLQQAVSSGRFATALKQAGLNVNQVSLAGTWGPGSPATQAAAPGSPPAQAPATTTPATAPATPPAPAPASPPAAAVPSPAQASTASASGNSAPSTSGSSHSGLGVGGIVGIVVGIVAALALLGLLAGCLLMAQRRRRRADRNSLKSSPSTPAVPPPTSPVLQRQHSNTSADGSFTAGGGRPRSQTEAQMERTASGKTNVIPYSQYRKSRLDSIRNDLGLQGGPGGQRDGVGGANSGTNTPTAGGLRA